MNYPNLDDKALIALIARSHTSALDELYSRYSRLVFSLALNVVSDHAAAEEITLDVFTRIWDRAGTYRPEQAQVNTWLVSITRHRAIDWLRRQNTRPERQSLNWAEVSPDSVPKADTPEETIESALLREQVRAAVAQLPPEQRQALALAYFKGYTHREIAEALAEPLGTIKTRIRLAMQKLRFLLQEE